MPIRKACTVSTQKGEITRAETTYHPLFEAS